jgi:cold shock CspA family protein
MTGTVVRVMKDRKFGFIKGRDKRDYFFHREDFNGHFEDLVADVEAKQIIEVEFNIVQSAKGPRAGEVTRLDNGIGELPISV